MSNVDKSTLTCCDMLHKAIEALNTEYGPGTLKYIREQDPETLNRIEAAETMLNQIYRQITQGQATVEQFREALKKWFILQREAFRKYGQVAGNKTA